MKQQSEAVIFGDRTPRESVGEGIVRQLFGYNDSILMAKVEFDAGAVGSVHAHPRTQVTLACSALKESYRDRKKRS